MNTTEVLIAAVVKGVRASLLRFISDHPRERLAAYALCTEDDLRTLFHMATSAAEVDAADDPDFVFVASDWSWGAGEEAFDEANQILVTRYEAAGERGFEEHVQSSFQCLVSALAALRDEGAFPSDVTLIVGSPDPGPLLEELEGSAVKSLNGPTTFAAWKVAMGC